MLPSLPGPGDLLALPRSIARSVRALGAALPHAEALLRRADDALDRVGSLVDRSAPVLARTVAAGSQVLDTASEVLARVADVLTPERAVALGELVDRLDDALTPGRVAAAATALDALRSRADVLPRALDVVERAVSSPDLERLGGALGRLLADGRLDRLLGLVTEDRVDRVDRLLDRLDRLLAEDHVGWVERLPSDERAAAAVRALVRLDEALSGPGSEALATVVARLRLLLTEERISQLAALADQVPRLLGALDGDLPTARELRQVPPDLHAMLEVLDSVHQILSGMPGTRLARQRGDDPHPQV